MSLKENSNKLENLLKLGFDTEVENVLSDACPFCGKSVKDEDFRDDISKREFEISGLCQKCQDKVFGGTSDE